MYYTHCNTVLFLHCCIILACILGFHRLFRSLASQLLLAFGWQVYSFVQSIIGLSRSSSGTFSLWLWTCPLLIFRVIIWRQICLDAWDGARLLFGLACSGQERISRNRPIFTWMIYFEILFDAYRGYWWWLFAANCWDVKQEEYLRCKEE